MRGTSPLPSIIQGGMGIAVSNWRLARAVASLGQLGVVSGTAVDAVFVRRLQDGDPGGDARRAMAQFPIPGVAAEALERFFRPAGRAGGEPYALLPMWQQVVTGARERIAMLAAFVEVHLAREGHDGPVGINLLTKVSMPNLALLYGAMLAGVDVVLMGAGIPRDIPAALAALAAHAPAEIRLAVEGEGDAPASYLRFEPAAHWDGAPPAPLRRPRFLPIVSSHTLATMLARKGGVDGFVVEAPSAGGHNAPPRGAVAEGATPEYGERDRTDLAQMRALGLPFWLAGSAGRRGGVRDAIREGAAGVQVGTLFAYCDESGMDADLRTRVLESVARGEVTVRTDWRASPTGYPFKVVQVGGAEPEERVRICDLGYLRSAYRMPDGRLGYRCASEPEDAYVAKDGNLAETAGRRCLCNGLLATIGQPQRRADGAPEPPLLTSGDDLPKLGTFLAGRTHYPARDVVDWLLAPGA